ncbi:hypothetical protein VIN01S_26350 [Vibrio inusitatus NBRC 102082]|uniref:Uncharacterized protein n=1 Tax=Vibrio inusitatus NBRC 102082 TaxID=1219070 RepID=A0A4Y3HXY3_9VIBR|nr:hypothetical protein [Vibrio inusitatus]GEA51831.1 hypothetical protein VIN01S_26350 [Vibrio inusitatus NBRC 102082]
MPLFIIRRLVLLLLVAALAPMQAFASDEKAQGVTTELLSYSQLFESEPTPASETPTSTSHVQHNTFAIVQNQRSVSVPKQELNDNEYARNTSNPNDHCINDDIYAFHAKWQTNLAAFHHDKSAYRLGGWKDSNALYVALNSQFSS